MAVFARGQQLEVQTIFDHMGGAPLTGHRHVVTEMPPEVVGKKLWTTVDLEPAQYIEALMIEQENPARTSAIRRAQGTHVDRVRAAMDGMRAAVARPRRDLLRHYHTHDFGAYRVAFDIDDMHSRRTQPWHQQIATLDMRMRSIGTKRGAAG